MSSVYGIFLRTTQQHFLESSQHNLRSMRMCLFPNIFRNCPLSIISEDLGLLFFSFTNHSYFRCLDQHGSCSIIILICDYKFMVILINLFTYHVTYHEKEGSNFRLQNAFIT